MSDLTAKELLSDGHTTLGEALELASECHELAEELAENCDDEAATLLSKSGAVLEMLVADARYWRELYAREGRKSMVLLEELSKRPGHVGVNGDPHNGSLSDCDRCSIDEPAPSVSKETRP